MASLVFCCHSVAPFTSKDDITASAICHLYGFILVDWYISWPTWFSSCCCSLSCNPSHFAALGAQSMNRR